jgi:small subunit ribosomal protein S15
MHSGAKGKAGSTKPIQKTTPTWLSYKKNEVELIIAKLAKEGLTASQIGLHLRDRYGIPDVKLITEVTITQILKEKKLTKKLPEDISALIKKSIAVKKHLETNKSDKAAIRGMHLTESKIRRLVKYYKKAKVLPKDWVYDPSQARFYLE